ncbi:MAG: TlyA family RNA methyltransferase [Clostridiales bacterium]|nr:TlyA family RNA methyltransferase [Clostridiales bacterium]
MKKERLDMLVFSRGLTESRERAKTEIMSGNVYVDGQRQLKPGVAVSPDADITLKDMSVPYVSRGGLKLDKALAVFRIDPTGKVCLDCGASTGGFTDCLLKNGAKKVYAVDVGYGQLAWSLRSDHKVIVLERTNIRYVTKSEIPEPIDLAVIDVSFISLKLVLPAVIALMHDKSEAVCLIKPQFEAGKEKVGKKGVVRDEKTHRQVLTEFIGYAKESGFSPKALSFSPIRGPEGNIEYLGYLTRKRAEAYDIDVAEVVSKSHEAFIQ